MWLLIIIPLLVAAIHIACAPLIPSYGDEGCDTEEELHNNLLYVKAACAHESFVDQFNPIPTTCSAPVCANAVLRVASTCGNTLARSSWFDKARNELQAAVVLCVRVPHPTSPTYVVQDPAAAAGGGQPITSCTGTLTDGDGQYGNNWQRVATIDAGPGKKVKLTFELIDLDFADKLEIWDGKQPDKYSRYMARGRNCTLPLPLISGGRFLFLKLETNKHGIGAGFVARISCVCEDATSWRDDSGRDCSAYREQETKTDGKSLFDSCETSPNTGTPAGRGYLEKDLAGLTLQGLALSAKDACPYSCQACTVDPCNSFACHNGGSCLDDAPDACESLAQFSSYCTRVTTACCNEQSESCAGGTPDSCNLGCAEVLRPMIQACVREPKGIMRTQASQFRRITQQLQRVESSMCPPPGQQGHRQMRRRLSGNPMCSCLAGFSGKHCEVVSHAAGEKGGDARG